MDRDIQTAHSRLVTFARTDAAAHADASRSRPPLWVPLILLSVGSVTIRAADWDRLCQHALWSQDQGWYLEDSAWVQFLYRYGTWPALIFGGICLLAWISSVFVPRFKPMGLFGAFIIIALAIGPGFSVNTVFKGFYGRPRPRQVVEFGGTQVFHPLGQPTFDSRGKSFPSGHSSMGFFWFAPSIFFWQQHRRAALGFAAIALLHGGIMSLGRMAQGGHWLSDNLWAAGIVYLSSWLVFYIVCVRKRKVSVSLPHFYSAPRGKTALIEQDERT